MLDTFIYTSNICDGFIIICDRTVIPYGGVSITCGSITLMRGTFTHTYDDTINTCDV